MNTLLEKEKSDMETCAEKLRKLDPIQRMIMIAKIDALYDRQEMEKALEEQGEKRELQLV